MAHMDGPGFQAGHDRMGPWTTGARTLLQPCLVMVLLSALFLDIPDRIPVSLASVFTVSMTLGRTHAEGGQRAEAGIGTETGIGIADGEEVEGINHVQRLC